MTTPKLISWQDALRAIADGKKVEHRSTCDSPSGSWFWLGDSVLVSTLKSGIFQFRLAEDPTPEPMRAEDWPAFFWVRFKDPDGPSVGTPRMAICIENDGSVGIVTHIPSDRFHLLKPGELACCWQYSTDRKTWKPCNRSSLAGGTYGPVHLLA